MQNKAIQINKDSSKGQKIIAALYLVTAHLSDTDPVRSELRASAVDLSIAASAAERMVHIETITTLLGAGVLARIISEKNAELLALELRYFADNEIHDAEDMVAALFPAPQYKGQAIEKKIVSPTYMSLKDTNVVRSPIQKTIQDSSNKYEVKDKRQTTILSFISNKKSATVKDIAALFPEVSEKTIQRELGALVATGQISKRGSKRWSIYLAAGTN